jgi:hypothetical protein
MIKDKAIGKPVDIFTAIEYRTQHDQCDKQLDEN